MPPQYHPPFHSGSTPGLLASEEPLSHVLADTSGQAGIQWDWQGGNKLLQSEKEPKVEWQW